MRRREYPTTEPALQAVDYFLWALQRTYEKREDRFLELVCHNAAWWWTWTTRGKRNTALTTQSKSR
jgi:starvation-inducible outer membrane lipoprotein